MHAKPLCTDDEVCVKSLSGSIGLGRDAPRKLLLQNELHGWRVLVVDDLDSARQALGGTLTTMRFMVDTVPSCERGAGYDPAGRRSRPPLRHCVAGMANARYGRNTDCPAHARVGAAAAPQLAMLSAHGRGDLAAALARAPGTDIAEVLDKPVVPSYLFDTLIELLGVGLDGALTTHRVMASDAIPDALRDIQGARILLAEDNALN